MFLYNYTTDFVWFSKNILQVFYKISIKHNGRWHIIGFFPAGVQIIYRNKSYGTIEFLNILSRRSKIESSSEFLNSVTLPPKHLWYDMNNNINKRAIVLTIKMFNS